MRNEKSFGTGHKIQKASVPYIKHLIFIVKFISHLKAGSEAAAVFSSCDPL